LLPLFAPWIFLLSLPTLAINLLSSNDQMHSGLAFYHYDAELVPVLIFSTIEAMALFLALTQRFFTPVLVQGAMGHDGAWKPRNLLSFTGSHRVVLVLMTVYLLGAVIHYDTLQGPLPISKEYQWPVVTTHDTLAQHFIKDIPSTASVSAQSALVPHVSHRASIYLFPYGDGVTTPAYASYIFLDKTSDPYPYYDTSAYEKEVSKVLRSGTYNIVKQQDGYMLLKLSHPAVVPSTSSIYPQGRKPESGVALRRLVV